MSVFPANRVLLFSKACLAMAALAWVGCAASDDAESSYVPYDAHPDPSDVPRGGDARPPDSGGAVGLNPLCGVGACDPGYELACVTTPDAGFGGHAGASGGPQSDAGSVVRGGGGAGGEGRAGAGGGSAATGGGNAGGISAHGGATGSGGTAPIGQDASTGITDGGSRAGAWPLDGAIFDGAPNDTFDGMFGNPPPIDGDASSGEGGGGGGHGADASVRDGNIEFPEAGYIADATSGFGGGNREEAGPNTPRDDSGASADSGPAVPGPVGPSMGCHVRIQVASVYRTCEVAGTGRANDPCQDSSDCAAGFGCVEANGLTTGRSYVCRQFVCTPASCPDGTFYDELPLRDQGVTRLSFLVPVCSPADNCRLLENSCVQGRVCTVVGQATSSCLPPGTAQRDQPCSTSNRCAPGLVCSKSTNRCLKLCSVDSNDCAGGACQGGSQQLPTGFGVCVGDSSDASVVR